MNRIIALLCCSFIGVALLGTPVFAQEPAPATSNLLAGTKYEQLLALAGRPGALDAGDKGFLPNFGNYFDNATPGWGLDIQKLGNFIFAVWFTYNPDGTPTWFIIVGELNGMTVTGNIESFKWDPFGNPGSQATASVRGSMTIAWTDASNADVSWTLDGVSGGASVDFARFAPPPTLANMTGHYFDPVRPGWGFTLLTQGTVTVMTMYWYKNGQPVWAQAVAPDMGFTQVFLMLYFSGPGLCPSCLPRKTEKGPAPPTTTELASLQVDWTALTYPTPGEPPEAGAFATLLEPGTFGSAKGGPLGDQPFGDIIIPVTTRGITSVFGDNYDNQYAWFRDLLPDKGDVCLPFQYDPGIIDFPATLTGLTGTAYIDTVPHPHSGRMRVYTDPNCTENFTFDTFNGPGRTDILAAPTGEGGVVLVWRGKDPAIAAKGDDDFREYSDENRAPMVGGLLSTSQGLAMCMYGMMTAQYFALWQATFVIFLFYSVFPPVILPPALDFILQNPCLTSAVIAIFLIAGST